MRVRDVEVTVEFLLARCMEVFRRCPHGLKGQLRLVNPRKGSLLHYFCEHGANCRSALVHDSKYRQHAEEGYAAKV